MTTPGDGESAVPRHFEIAVAFASDDGLAAGPGTGAGRPPGYSGIPGVSDTFGDRQGLLHVVVEKGEGVFRQATEALAKQIGTTAQLIADAIAQQQQPAAPAPGAYGLDSVQVQFGVTLSGGLQTVFTAQAQSSVQVTITLSRPKPDHSGGS